MPRHRRRSGGQRARGADRRRDRESGPWASKRRGAARVRKREGTLDGCLTRARQVGLRLQHGSPYVMASLNRPSPPRRSPGRAADHHGRGLRRSAEPDGVSKRRARHAAARRRDFSWAAARRRDYSRSAARRRNLARAAARCRNLARAEARRRNLARAAEVGPAGQQERPPGNRRAAVSVAPPEIEPGGRDHDAAGHERSSHASPARGFRRPRLGGREHPIPGCGPRRRNSHRIARREARPGGRRPST